MQIGWQILSSPTQLIRYFRGEACGTSFNRLHQRSRPEILVICYLSFGLKGRWQYRCFGSDYGRAIELPARMGQLSPPALLRAWAVRDFHVGASIFSFSPRSGICPDFCGLLLLSNLLSQLEVSPLPPALFSRLFHSQFVWR